MSGTAAVAAGNADTAAAAAAVLRAGGNAVDAAVAAGFASAVTEPGLSSLGGGGFLLAAPADGPERVLDFFVDAPGRGRPADRLVPSFLPVTLRFAGADQVFHAGWGSVAVPGCLDGYLHAARTLGRLPLAQVVAPAAELARHGTVVDAAQAQLLVLLEDILTLTPEGRQVFAPDGRLLHAGERMRNPALADLLDDVGAGSVTGIAALAGPLQDAADGPAGCSPPTTSRPTPCTSASRCGPPTAARSWPPTRRRRSAGGWCSRPCRPWRASRRRTRHRRRWCGWRRP
jgi:gamma-glutamyltranspeptidase/glutathione hydrolase